jgi:hypothetical protein
MTVPAFCGEGTAMPASSPASNDDNALLTDTALPWLERVPLPDGNVLRMWRLRG